MISGGKIRKISYGQSGKDCQVSYQIANNDKRRDDNISRGGGIIEIIDDKEYFDLYNRRRFLVMKINKDGEAFPWKELIDMQVEVEYDEDPGYDGGN